MSHLMTVSWRWVRRLLCVFGGIAVVNFVVLSYIFIVHKAVIDQTDVIERIRPWTALVGAILGAWIIFRAERKQSRDRKSSPHA